VPYDDRVSEKRLIGYRQPSSIGPFFISNGDCTAMLGSAQLRNRQSTTRVRNAPAVALPVLCRMLFEVDADLFVLKISDTGVLKSRIGQTPMQFFGAQQKRAIIFPIAYFSHASSR